MVGAAGTVRRAGGESLWWNVDVVNVWSMVRRRDNVAGLVDSVFVRRASQGLIVIDVIVEQLGIFPIVHRAESALMIGRMCSENLKVYFDLLI